MSKRLGAIVITLVVLAGLVGAWLYGSAESRLRAAPSGGNGPRLAWREGEIFHARWEQTLETQAQGPAGTIVNHGSVVGTLEFRVVSVNGAGVATIAVTPKEMTGQSYVAGTPVVLPTSYRLQVDQQGRLLSGHIWPLAADPWLDLSQEFCAPLPANSDRRWKVQVTRTLDGMPSQVYTLTEDVAPRMAFGAVAQSSYPVSATTNLDNGLVSTTSGTVAYSVVSSFDFSRHRVLMTAEETDYEVMDTISSAHGRSQTRKTAKVLSQLTFY